MYREMSVCKHCWSGELQLYNTVLKLVVLHTFYSHALNFSKYFWSVSGRFMSNIDVASGKVVAKRNSQFTPVF